MDFQWRNQLDESEHQYQNNYPPKMPKLHHYHHDHHIPSSELPLFVAEPKITSNMIPRRGGYFSLGQWQELELQALVFRYLVAGAAVPHELLHTINNTLLSSSPYYLNHFQPSLLQTGYWGRVGMDPEPGRCRRTDGKKWRCSRDVVAGNKYCERHMHRGRNRSRKPVENPTPVNTVSAAAVGGGGAATPIAGHFGLGLSSSHPKHVNKSLLISQTEVAGGNKSDGHVLRHFFDDLPRTIQETDLSISLPESSSSDVSLKLSTGIDGDEQGSRNDNGEREQQQVNWGGVWSSSDNVSTMGGGGPLAEALRSSTTAAPSPTSVLGQ